MLRCYGRSGRCIVYVDTMIQAEDLMADAPLSRGLDQLCVLVASQTRLVPFTMLKNRLCVMFASDFQVLHGGLPQEQRDAMLTSFRRGEFRVLLIGDVTLFGLDIQGVDLIVQCEVWTFGISQSLLAVEFVLHSHLHLDA